jgi:hypothetical protein
MGKGGNLAMAGTPPENDPAAIAARSDDILSRLLGGDMQTATLRLVLYLAAVAVIVATLSLLT